MPMLICRFLGFYLCHFLYISERAGIADQSVQPPFDPKLGDIAGELDHLYDETADEGDPDPISLPPEMPEPA